MMTATVTPFETNQPRALEDLLSVCVSSSLESPAQSLRLEAAADSFPGELGEVEVRSPFQTLFAGRVDRQQYALSGRGSVLTLEARSKGALLLDNEAVPCTMSNVNLSAVFSRFIAPYGFLLYHPSSRGSLAFYTVHKGRCEWEALVGFMLRVYGRRPYVSGDQVMADRPRSGAPLVVGGAGIAFTELLHTHKPYAMLSKVVMRDQEGYYRSAVHNSAAPYYGVQRKRYVIPASEFVDSPQIDANQRIRRSMLEKESVLVTLPGIVPVAPGREVRIADERLTRYNLTAREVTWRQDAGGVTTQIALISSIYYD